MLRTVCCNADVIGKGGGEEYLNHCEDCNDCVEGSGQTYDDESPHEIAEQFNLEYIGNGNNEIRGKSLYYFNDLSTKSTIVVYNLSEFESKVTESRKKFKGE